MTTDAAIGFRAHSGWAVLVAVAGPRPSPTVISRRRIVLADPAIPGSVQPYHAAADLAPEEAEQLINRCRNAGRWLAQQALRITLDDLKGQGYQATACGLLLSSARPLPVLAAILASHALIHTAEGELFRDVLTYASEHHRLPVMRIKERELLDRGSAELRIPAGELRRRLSELGRTVGPPWRQDEKYAALAGWLSLTASTL